MRQACGRREPPSLQNETPAPALRRGTGEEGAVMLGTVAEKRASLASSKEKWSRVDMQAMPSTRVNGKAGNHKQDGVQQWLLSSCQEKSESHLDATEPLKRGTSGEDDLVLGVEASLYGKTPELKTLRQPLWSKQVGPPLSRWNSQASASSAHSTLSVMDVLNLWHDDPEELLLELGFGSEEPDISVRIPARFINHKSRARGINIQLFLEAQKNRMDLENPDVSNRFRQLEVLHQVTSVFSALVPGPPPAPAPGSSADLSDASRDRRRRLGQLFRRASKKTLSTTQSQPPLPGNPRKSPGGTKTPESFEIEEIHSFDEGSAGRGAAELGEAAEAKFMRTNSCQSDSSGFLEEPVIPSLSIQTSPVPELMKGAAYSPQAAGLECDRTTGEEGISLNPLAQTGTGFVPGQTFDESEDPRAARTSFGEMETGSGADESPGPGEPVALLCSRCRGSLRTQGGSVAPRAESERGRGWSEEGEAEAGGAESFRPDWASFGSSKSVSVQMPSSLPSVSQTTRRRCPAPPLDLRREMADALAAGSRGRGWKLSQGRSQKRSASLDTGLAREEEEEGEGEEEVGRWEAGAHCCCACEHRCPSCSWYSHRPAGELNSAALQLLHKTASCSSPFTFSLDELEGMMRCVRRFRCVLEETGRQLQGEESQVYSHLSDLDREDVASVRQLRAAVRKEAELLETQLAELANHCDTGITTKMQRLLDEQSELCLQLRIPSEPLHWGPVHSHRAPPWGPVSPRPSVGTQCCLLPDLLVSSPSATAALPETQCTSPPPGGTVTLEHDGAQQTPPDKQDLLAFLGFFQSLKDSLRHSVNSDGVE
ncbi:hypothetical protein COCON_G00070380 [Conger conger]|uniref:ITPR-interacting domain-containing protein n=1 Tax=Conger conger TaxID=82655 RepID=A0A9Q1DT94_CONCO|nr:hypothetical protein COCON_G00070380 [Conger conger]